MTDSQAERLLKEIQESSDEINAIEEEMNKTRKITLTLEHIGNGYMINTETHHGFGETIGEAFETLIYHMAECPD